MKEYLTTILSFNNNENVINESKRIESTLLDFPFHLKYKSERYNNIRTFIITGLKYSLDIASQDKIDDEGEELVKLKKHDVMAEIGFGIDFYLEYFKFSPQIKLSHGILNVLNKENTIYTKSFNQLRTNGWMLSFTLSNQHIVLIFRYLLFFIIFIFEICL